MSRKLLRQCQENFKRQWQERSCAISSRQRLVPSDLLDDQRKFLSNTKLHYIRAKRWHNYALCRQSTLRSMELVSLARQDLTNTWFLCKIKRQQTCFFRNTCTDNWREKDTPNISYTQEWPGVPDSNIKTSTTYCYMLIATSTHY